MCIPQLFGGSQQSTPAPSQATPLVTDPTVQNQANTDTAQRMQQQRAYGFLSLILTGGLGDTSSPTTSKVSLGAGGQGTGQTQTNIGPGGQASSLSYSGAAAGLGN